MPFTSLDFNVRLSDLVFHEIDAASGYARECINVTPLANGLPLKIGHVVFRPKTTVNPATAYTVLSAAADLSADNEYAVVFGDGFGFNPSFVPFAVQATNFNAVSFKRGMVQLKEYFIKAIAQSATNVGGAALNDAQFATLKELLKRQDVIVETTV